MTTTTKEKRNIKCKLSRKHKYREEDEHGYKGRIITGRPCIRNGCTHLANL